MKHLAIAFVVLVILSGCVGIGGNLTTYRLFDIAKDTETTLGQILGDIKKRRIILVGETHDQKSHHMAQLMIIRSLYESGVPVAVGLEMFQSRSQTALNGWINGQMDEEDFQKVYYENWNAPWHLYSSIFNYAKKMKIPLVGLNVPREITRHVARDGFRSLSKEQKGKLADLTCEVSADYMAFIRRVYGAHPHGHINFIYFCEAQLVWDNAMAIEALEYLEANPRVSLVLLTGTGHAWKKGIPEQIRLRSALLFAVILPHVPGNIEPGKVGKEDADYIILDLLKVGASL